MNVLQKIPYINPGGIMVSLKCRFTTSKVAVSECHYTFNQGAFVRKMRQPLNKNINAMTCPTSHLWAGRCEFFKFRRKNPEEKPLQMMYPCCQNGNYGLSFWNIFVEIQNFPPIGGSNMTA